MSYEVVSFWTSAFSLVLQVVSMFPRDKRDRTRDQEEALLALSKAYHATEAYYAFLGSHPRDREREWEVADLWCGVSVRLRKYDNQIAQRLDLKSRYWREGATWSADAIKTANIGLARIWTEVNVRLNEK